MENYFTFLPECAIICYTSNEAFCNWAMGDNRPSYLRPMRQRERTFPVEISNTLHWSTFVFDKNVTG